MLPATLLVGALMFWVFGHPGFAKFLWAFGFLAFLTGLTGTRVAWPFYYSWMGFVYVVATVIGVLTLSVVYYGVVAPIGLVARFFGRDRLRLVRRPRGSSLWTPAPKAEGVNHFERQF